MAVRTVTPASVLLPIGGLWTIEVCTVDVDGDPVAGAPVLTITLPAGTTAAPVVEEVELGGYRWTYTVGTAGRYVARAVSASYGAVDFAAYATATTAGVGMPVADDVAAYMGTDATSWSELEIQDALDAEAAAQRDVCRVEAVYPDSLRQALLRRSARNLAMRAQVLGVTTGDADAGPQIMAWDVEIRRYERPWRRLPIG